VPCLGAWPLLLISRDAKQAVRRRHANRSTSRLANDWQSTQDMKKSSRIVD